jgi:ABC-2 type transport system ATP-binding protein
LKKLYSLLKSHRNFFVDNRTFKVDNLCKTISGKEILKNISFTISKGEIFGLLGPNGAGKTTMLRTLMNLMEHDSGEISFGDMSHPDFLPRHVSYMPEERGLYSLMRVGEQLVYFGCLKGLSKKDAKNAAIDILGRLDMESFYSQRIEHLSRGIQQKVQLAIPLMIPTDLIFLDEPFAGLDPLSMVEVVALIKTRAMRGCRFIITSHQLEQVQKICDTLLLLEQGNNILSGPRDKILKPGVTLEEIFLKAVTLFRGRSS